jgi:hypothetical protein
MFDRRRDDVPPPHRQSVIGKAEDRKVVAFGRAARKNDVAALRIDDGRYTIAGPFDGAPRPLAIRMAAAASVAKILAEVPQDFISDKRLNGRRGSAVEVNGHLDTSINAVLSYVTIPAMLLLAVGFCACVDGANDNVKGALAATAGWALS